MEHQPTSEKLNFSEVSINITSILVTHPFFSTCTNFDFNNRNIVTNAAEMNINRSNCDLLVFSVCDVFNSLIILSQSMLGLGKIQYSQDLLIRSVEISRLWWVLSKI